MSTSSGPSGPGSTSGPGDRETLVMLHGIGASGRHFSRISPQLSERFDIVTVDLPAHGEAPPLDVPPTVATVTDAVEASLDAAGIGRAHVLGDSLGGRVALELAQRGRALSVVAIAPPGMGFPLERVYQAGVLSVARLVARAWRPALPALARNPYARTLMLPGLQALPWRSTEDDVLALEEGLAGSDQYWPMLFGAVLWEVPTGFERVDCPVLLAQGALDVLIAGQTPRFLPIVPGSRFRLLPWAGHAPMSDVPDEVARLVHEAADAALEWASAEVGDDERLLGVA